MRRSVRLTAFHEAGHAVVAFVLGRRPRRASIVAESGALGHVLIKWTDDLAARIAEDRVEHRDRLAIERFVMTCFGGAAALTVLGSSRPKDGADDDFERAERVLARTVGSDRELVAYALWLRERTLNIVKLHWGAVREVATALQARRELRARPLADLIDAHMFEHFDECGS